MLSVREVLWFGIVCIIVELEHREFMAGDSYYSAYRALTEKRIAAAIIATVFFVLGRAAILLFAFMFQAAGH